MLSTGMVSTARTAWQPSLPSWPATCASTRRLRARLPGRCPTQAKTSCRTCCTTTGFRPRSTTCSSMTRIAGTTSGCVDISATARTTTQKSLPDPRATSSPPEARPPTTPSTHTSSARRAGTTPNSSSAWRSRHPFMPTTHRVRATKADQLIQFSSFADLSTVVRNLGVAPDFACGHQIRLPDWLQTLEGHAAVRVAREVHLRRHEAASTATQRDGPASTSRSIASQPTGTHFLEAFDTWIKTGSFADFVDGVMTEQREYLPEEHEDIDLPHVERQQRGIRNLGPCLPLVPDRPPRRRGHACDLRVLDRLRRNRLASATPGMSPIRFLNGSVLNSTGARDRRDHQYCCWNGTHPRPE